MGKVTRVPGTPFRLRVDEPASEPADKVDFSGAGESQVVPVPVRIEVAGGRSLSASAMRAAKVVYELEVVGASACTVELGPDRALLEGDADLEQALHVARCPFVKSVKAG